MVKVAQELPFRSATTGMDPEGKFNYASDRRILTRLPRSAAYSMRRRYGQKETVEKPMHIE